MIKKFFMTVAITSIILLSSGCYYSVKDVASGKTYYTRKVHSKLGGAIVITDEKTKAKVTLQSHEVQTIKKKEYFKKIRKKNPNAFTESINSFFSVFEVK